MTPQHPTPGSLRSFAVSAALLILASGCAPQEPLDTTAAPAGEAVIEVNNDLLPPTSLTIWVVPEGGTRQRIGTVTPGATTNLRHAPAAPGQYRLMARTADGTEILSNPVTLARGSTLRWDVSANIVR